jgi:sugar phosphate isomerase/epimerase
MKLGFVSAILPDLDLNQVLEFAAQTGYECVEIMCWPVGKAERKYAGVTHLDVTQFTAAQVAETKALIARHGVQISGLGYYPNPLAPDPTEAKTCIDHIKKVILAAEKLGLKQVNTFIGRDWTKTVDENWPRFMKVWPALVAFAEQHQVRIGIENCPMYFTRDEWPSGKNLAHCPAVWRRMFEAIPSRSFGLNYDPSHMIWQHMDYLKPMREFADRLFHIHAKDVRLDQHRLDEVGILATPLEYHRPKLPGLGEVNWGKFCSVLSDVGYQGPVCVEVEDKAYEASLETRKAALRQSYHYLRNFIA